MKLTYYPGCTLKTKAANLEDSALAALEALGIEARELERWNCCGAVFSLADDDLLHHLAPVRNLIRVQEAGCDTVVTLCSQCYNVLARANLLMRGDAEKRDTINRFMDEEPDYAGGVEVVHYLKLLEQRVGWDALRARVKVPLTGLKVAPFYGCTLIRPADVALAAADEQLFEGFLAALGAEPVAYAAARECCGAYQGLAHPAEGMRRAGKVLATVARAGADAIALSCPLCEYNLGTRQAAALAEAGVSTPIPTYYFTQLLAVALGLEAEVCRLELNGEAAIELLRRNEYLAPAAV